MHSDRVVVCTVADCDREVESGELCVGHQKQRQRHPDRPLRPLREDGRCGQPAIDHLREAALAYADAPAEDDAEFRRRDQNLLAAALSYAQRLGRAPPARLGGDAEAA